MLWTSPPAPGHRIFHPYVDVEDDMIEDETTLTGTALADLDNMTQANIDARKSTCPNNDPYVRWAGRSWWLNYQWEKGTYVWGSDPRTPQIPGFNSNFDPKRFFTLNSDGTLTLRTSGTEDGKCVTAEIVLADVLGYGHYVVTARAKQPTSFAKFDDNVCFGVFTYQWGQSPESEGPNRHKEMDLLETLSKNSQGRPGNAQFTLQPAGDNPDLLINRFAIPADCQDVTLWLYRRDPNRQPLPENHTRFSIHRGSHSYDELKANPSVDLIHYWSPGSYEGTDEEREFVRDRLPRHQYGVSKERLHINLYLTGVEAPARKRAGSPPSQTHEVTLTRFEFLAVGGDGAV
ncbi:hypothetical protein JRC04_18845 [Mycolicibacterium sp. S2-37]|uniref:hypothetical protein n=1 Tax=Mycolicibacterium sp. S2-37 TaxID=2810297 RepID=UPI001A94E6EB|nr:hypothetical protein [Mycolicibacterium sp. S2-37]MBO0679525.1 hypothetical protein [Mycolicibacterium sp. S2-37]